MSKKLVLFINLAEINRGRKIVCMSLQLLSFFNGTVDNPGSNLASNSSLLCAEVINFISVISDLEILNIY